MDMVVDTCSPRAWEVEIEGSEVQYHPLLHRKFQTRLGYARLCLRTKKQASKWIINSKKNLQKFNSFLLIHIAVHLLTGLHRSICFWDLSLGITPHHARQNSGSSIPENESLGYIFDNYLYSSIVFRQANNHKVTITSLCPYHIEWKLKQNTEKPYGNSRGSFLLPKAHTPTLNGQ